MVRFTADELMHAMVEPGRAEQWLHWTRQTPEQRDRVATIGELEKLLQSDKVGDLAILCSAVRIFC